MSYPSWLAGATWLYGMTNLAYGSRLKIGATTTSLSVAGALWPSELIENIDARLVADHAPDWRCEVDDAALGTVRIHGSSPATLTAPDRLLAILGYDLECGEVQAAATEHRSRCPMPIALPIQGCDAKRVDREREKSFRLSSFRRGHGSAYGDSDIWRFDLVLDAPAVDALRMGFCAGRVMVSPFNLAQHISGEAEHWSSTSPGYIDGQVIGFEGGAWDNPNTRLFYRTSLLLATAAA